METAQSRLNLVSRPDEPETVVPISTANTGTISRVDRAHQLSARIAIIRQKYRCDGGGERIIQLIRQILTEQGHRISMITRSWRGAENEAIICNPPQWTRVQREALFARTAIELSQQHSFDLVQSHERIPGCELYRAGDGVHRSWLEQRSRQLGTLRKKLLWSNRFHRYQLQVEQQMFEHSRLKAVICNSRMVQRDIISRFKIDPAKVQLIYNGVDLETFHPRNRSSREEIRERWQIPQHVPLFLFVGSGWERKGLKQVMQALSEVPDAWLMVVGKEKHHNTYTRLANQLRTTNRVRFTGVQQNVSSFYGAADSFILPALYDPFPNAILEAMASGLPVITSFTCGGAEFLEDGTAGAVVDAMDVTALARVIQAWSKLDDLHEMGQSAREKVKACSPDRMRTELIQLYQQLLQE